MSEIRRGLMALGAGNGGWSINDIFQGTEPSGDVAIKLTADVPRCGISGRAAMTSLTVDLTSGYEILRTGIYYNPALTTLHLIYPDSNTKVVKDYTFTENSELLTVVLQGQVKDFSSNAMRGNTKLKTVDIESLSSLTTGFDQNCFLGNSAMDTLIIRETTGAVALRNINNFSNTPFASGKAGGTLYVPNSLITSYQTASNWSTILGYSNNSIKSIESTHTDPNAPFDMTLYYADGTPISS